MMRQRFQIRPIFEAAQATMMRLCRKLVGNLLVPIISPLTRTLLPLPTNEMQLLPIRISTNITKADKLSWVPLVTERSKTEANLQPLHDHNRALQLHPTFQSRRLRGAHLSTRLAATFDDSSRQTAALTL
jgi:hypothetical protein